MVRREVVIVEDDLDGGPAKETVRFGLDGADYEIDLNAKNARKFRKRLAPFVEHAHRVAAGQRRPARTAASRQRSRDIRAWARQQGIELSDRGRMPASIVDEYEASTGQTARRLPAPHPPPVSRRQDGRGWGSGPAGAYQAHAVLVPAVTSTGIARIVAFQDRACSGRSGCRRNSHRRAPVRPESGS
jgi:Lsr2